MDGLMKYVLMGLLLAVLMTVHASAVAAERTWHFKVYLDEKPIGSQTFRVTDAKGERDVYITAHLKVKVLFVTVFDYEHTNHEQWRGECLSHIASETEINGKRFSVRTGETNNSLRVSNGATQEVKVETLPDCAMTFAYWDPAMLQQSRLLNSQTGEYTPVDAQFVAKETIDVQGAAVLSNHYRVRASKLNIDLWYTPQGEWLQLESDVRGGRKLRYQLDDPAVVSKRIAKGS